MKKPFSPEFTYQIFSLLVITIIVHAIYVTVIRPTAEAELEQQAVQINLDRDYVPKRSVYVLVRDYEQETCFILMFWALVIMGYKASHLLRERDMLDMDLLHAKEGIRFLPQDMQKLSRQIQSLSEEQQGYLLPRALQVALHRFNSTRNIQDVSLATRSVCESESERLDSELSIIRYITWAIPSIGFLGTVRGIGDALGQAHKAVEGNIAGVTESLGVAFNSTLIALCISIVLMFIVYQLQLLQERLILDTQNYCNHNLIRHLQAE
ncbi:MAG: MotA/TolQ/ExbB proton channel family protein [Proteobacteria bacterium]|nr:MotA/TolQ/ExbB proton channel family protein [Pseudomonadota bacterium]